MEPNALAFAVGVVSSLFYLSLYLAGLGWPLAFVTLFIFALRLVSSLALFVHVKATLVSSLGASFVALTYLASLLFNVVNFGVYLTFMAELANTGAILYALSRLTKTKAKTKYVTPLDLPVYG